MWHLGFRILSVSYYSDNSDACEDGKVCGARNIPLSALSTSSKRGRAAVSGMSAAKSYQMKVQKGNAIGQRRGSVLRRHRHQDVDQRSSDPPALMLKVANKQTAALTVTVSLYCQWGQRVPTLS